MRSQGPLSGLCRSRTDVGSKALPSSLHQQRGCANNESRSTSNLQAHRRKILLQGAPAGVKGVDQHVRILRRLVHSLVQAAVKAQDLHVRLRELGRWRGRSLGLGLPPHLEHMQLLFVGSPGHYYGRVQPCSLENLTYFGWVVVMKKNHEQTPLRGEHEVHEREDAVDHHAAAIPTSPRSFNTGAANLFIRGKNIGGIEEHDIHLAR
mmetsp:Transcript_37469/g.70329  ORF Transcript_37469/g.70329 Transcript_37469/m.70329 type:complete len:207 (-) Transcript_37469:99-719(-)